MDSSFDVGKVVKTIMDNPDLIEKIKSLAVSGEEKTLTDETEEAFAKSDNGGHTEAHRGGHRGKERSALLCSLKPYLSEKRRGAVDTAIAALEVLELVLAKR